MRKSILTDEKVKNLIIKSIIGEHAENQYEAKQTEWTNYALLDVLYCPNTREKEKTLPSVLIEVQYAANSAFFRRLIEHSLMIRKQSPLLPVVVIIAINSTSQDFKDQTYESEGMCFGKKVRCNGWAQEVFYLSAETISLHIQQQPLHPLNAIGHFFIERKDSILDLDKRDDPTIKMLYEVARVFREEAESEGERNTINTICQKTTSHLGRAMKVLLEEVPESRALKRARDCLQDGIDSLDELRKKHVTLPSSSSATAASSSSATAASSSSATAASSSSARAPAAPAAETEAEASLVSIAATNDWQFINDFREQATRMNWPACFEAGKNLGLFGRYASMKSLRAAYYRAEKQKE